jgi:hypothetical protein
MSLHPAVTAPVVLAAVQSSVPPVALSTTEPSPLATDKRRSSQGATTAALETARLRPLRKKEKRLHARTPVTVHIEVLQGIDVPKYAGIFGSDPLWQPLASEPFVEVFIRRNADGIIMTKKMETSVHYECQWQAKFVLPVVFPWEKAAEYSLVLQLRDYRRFTEAGIMGEAEISLAAVHLHDAQSGTVLEVRRIPVVKTGGYFEVSKTMLEVKYHVPASLVPEQPADYADIEAAEGATEPPMQLVPKVFVDAGIQTDIEEYKPAFVWNVQSGNAEGAEIRNIPDHIPWVYEKWHTALNHKLRTHPDMKPMFR